MSKAASSTGKFFLRDISRRTRQRNRELVFALMLGAVIALVVGALLLVLNIQGRI